jgi:hypothetical protein
MMNTFADFLSDDILEATLLRSRWQPQIFLLLLPGGRRVILTASRVFAMCRAAGLASGQCHHLSRILLI